MDHSDGRVGRWGYSRRMLTDRQQAILKFEEDWSGRRANREAAIRDTFGVSPARYFQELHLLLDSAEALAADPVLVKRLNRLRYARFLSRRRPYSEGASA